MDSLEPAFYARDVLTVARELIGCVVSHGATSGVIVETEAYHDSEPASHGFRGPTVRTSALFGPPGHAYVYRSYGVHAMLNLVCEADGIGAAALIRALEPREGIELMRERRGRPGRLELCSGPGKLAQALDITLELDGAPLDGPELYVAPPPKDLRLGPVRNGPRIGITKAADLPWRFAVADCPYVSRPRL